MAIDQARTSNSSVSHQHGQCQCPSERTSRAVPRRRRSGEGRAVSHVRGRVPRHHGPCVPAWCRDTRMPRGTGPGRTAHPSASSRQGGDTWAGFGHVTVSGKTVAEPVLGSTRPLRTALYCTPVLYFGFVARQSIDIGGTTSIILWPHPSIRARDLVLGRRNVLSDTLPDQTDSWLLYLITNKSSQPESPVNEHSHSNYLTLFVSLDVEAWSLHEKGLSTNLKSSIPSAERSDVQ